jgi:hypothetical protein
MDKENLFEYEYENTSTRNLPYPLIALASVSTRANLDLGSMMDLEYSRSGTCLTMDSGIVQKFNSIC